MRPGQRVQVQEIRPSTGFSTIHFARLSQKAHRVGCEREQSGDLGICATHVSQCREKRFEMIDQSALIAPLSLISPPLVAFLSRYVGRPCCSFCPTSDEDSSAQRLTSVVHNSRKMKSMSSKSNRTALAVSLVGAVLAAAAAGVFILVIQPRQRKSAAKAEVVAFAEKWQQTRACFVGESPRSSIPGEAMVAAEMIGGDRKGALAVCRGSLLASGRKDGYSTGIADVESAWVAFKKTRSTLATALTYRTALKPQGSIQKLRERLSKALNDADDSYQVLRKAVRLSDDLLTGKPLPSPVGTPINKELSGAEVGGVLVNSNRVKAIRTDTNPGRLVLLGDGVETVTEIPDSATIPVGTASWFVERRERDLQVLGRDPASAPQSLSAPGEVFGAIGSDDGGRVVFTHDFEKGRSYQHIAASGTESFKSRELPADVSGPDSTEQVSYLFGRVYVQGAGRTMVWRSTSLSKPTIHDFEGAPCFGENVDWWIRGFDLAYATSDGDRSVSNSQEMPWQQVACTDSKVLGVAFADRPGIKIRICDPDACRASTTLPAPVGTRFFPLLGPTLGPVVAIGADDYLVVWAQRSEGKGLAPRAVIRTTATILGIVEWGGTLSAVGQNDKGVVVTLPIEL